MMENGGGPGSMLRNRSPVSYFDTNDESNLVKSVNDVEEMVKLSRDEVEWYDNVDDSLVCVLISWIRIVICFVITMVTTFIWALIMLLLLPWPYQRIRQANVYGHVTGRLLMWILGNPVKMEGMEYSKERAIYICNHASVIDTFLLMQLTPTGTVGIARKEIVWYPLFGQLYVLANNLLIDCSNTAAAIKSMKELATAVVKSNLSLLIFPEGTRSKNGRLLPFKKGFVHLALQTRLPIVPIVMVGTHNACRAGSLRVRPMPISVKYLPPIKTDNWCDDMINEYVNLVHDVYVKYLPEHLKPLMDTA